MISDIKTWEQPYVDTLSKIMGVPIDGKMWWDARCVFWDWQEHEQYGDAATRAERKHEEMTVIKYIAFLLRNDLDGSWHLHPYPKPVTERLRKVWSTAELLHYEDDLGQGFYGPSAHELIYLARAISVSKELGNTNFDDILPKLCEWKTWWMNTHDTDHEKALQDPEFVAWLEAGEFDWMFNHRGTKEEHDTRSRFVTHDEAVERFARFE
jgi:hypothetical protein